MSHLTGVKKEENSQSLKSSGRINVVGSISRNYNYI